MGAQRQVEPGCWEQVALVLPPASPEGTARLFSLSQALSLPSISIHLAEDETGWCARNWAQATTALPPALFLYRSFLRKMSTAGSGS